MIPKLSFIHKTSEISPKAKLGRNVKVWHYVQILEGAEIGDDSSIGKGVYIDKDVKIGLKCNIQNNASIYRGSVLENYVFIGPHVCFSNNKSPRSVNENKNLVEEGKDWSVKKIIIEEGASIGANVTLLPGITIGEYSLIGAGSVVTKNIPPFSLAYGNPARIHGKVDKSGRIKK